ncbi:MAG: FecR domain-containing protein [Gammaproteobacteria bacterium]|nr:FecR domain-containing protein [Gammaproteobacteria bacterium]
MSEAADIEAQAAAWIARCDALGCDHDPQLAAWLIADPRHRTAYLRLAHAWERTQRLARLRPADRSIDPDLLARAPRPWPMRWAAVAAGMVAAVIVVLWHLAPSSAAQTYRTGPGGLSRVFLADGSAVTLNDNTELRVHFTAARRGITLVRGEAHFSVTHDTHRPFEVQARDRVVVAVGTAFDVRVGSGQDVEVTVTEGRVALLKLATQPQPDDLALQTISAGQDALLTTRDVTVQHIDSAQISHRLAWERRQLSFEGETLSEAVAEFDRYTNRKIIIDDSSIAALQIGGSFRALDLDSFIAALGRAFGIGSRVTPQGTIHLYGVGNAKPARLHR